jgi:hypothetical protein
MASTGVYLCAAVAFILIAILFLIAAIQNSVDEKNLMATPTIPKANAVLTSFASTKIKATEDEVFAVITDFKDYTWSSSFTDYKFDNQQIPQAGSKGTFKVRPFLHASRSCLDLLS